MTGHCTFFNLWKFLPLSISGTNTYIDGTKDWVMMKKRLRFQMPHVPLKVLRGQQDEEDIQDQYYERFPAPPGTSTEEEEEANALRGSSFFHWDSTTDIGNVSESVGSIHSISESDNASDEGSEDVPSDHMDLNNTGYQTTGSVSHDAIELQAFADVHQLRNTEGDTTINTNNTGSGVASIGNVSEEAIQRYLGRHTSSIEGASQFDTASDEATGLQGLAQVHQPPNTDCDVASIGNVSEEAMDRYLGRHNGPIDNASQSDIASDEATGLQGIAWVHHLPNTDSDVASIGNVSEEAMQRYLGRHIGSIDNASQFDPGSQEGVGNEHNNTGYETMSSVSHEAIALQSFAQVHKPPNTECDVTINTDNISEEAMGRYLGRHTSSIDNIFQSDTASDETTGLQEFAQVHHPPNIDSDVISISNINEEIMQKYLGEHTGSINCASQSNTASHEGIGNIHNDQINNTGYEATGSVSNEAIAQQLLIQVSQPQNIESDDSDVFYDALSNVDI